MSNFEEKQYLLLLENVLNNGNERQTRNSITKSLFSANLKFDLKNGFPLMTTKKMYFKAIFEELMFFIRGQTDTKILENKNVNIWKGNTSRNFLDKVKLNHYQEGDMGPMYGFIFRHFGAEYNGCDNDYNCKGIDQFNYIIDTLLKDPFSRRIIMTSFNPSQVEQGCLYPCHSIVIQFYITEKNDKYYLSQQTYIRSNDMFHGAPFNYASSALLSILICHHLNYLTNSEKYIPDMLYVTLGDYHIYKEHYQVVEEQIKREPYPFPILKINKYRNKIEDYQLDDIDIINYNFWPILKANMVA